MAKSIDDLLAPMLKKRLVVAYSRLNATPEQIAPHVADHLDYMIGLEKSHKLFGSGPFVEPGVLVGDGLTILNTQDLEEARSLMNAEPLTKLGLRTCELRLWELREGRLSLDIDFSDTGFAVR